METLIHEFVHMHFGYTLKHGIEFRQIQGRWMHRFFGESWPVHFIGKYYDPVDGKTLVEKQCLPNLGSELLHLAEVKALLASLGAGRR